MGTGCSWSMTAGTTTQPVAVSVIAAAAVAASSSLAMRRVVTFRMLEAWAERILVRG